MAIDMSHPTSSALIERFFSEDVANFTERLARIERDVRTHTFPSSPAHLKALTDAAEESRAACRLFEEMLGDNPEQITAAQDAYRKAIAPWFGQSWFMERARTKPKGYPGDYVILTGIYDRHPKSKGIGAYLDAYFLETQLGRAVPGRMRAVRQFLINEMSRREGQVSILNIACGPCREFVGGLDYPANVAPKFTVVDSDQEALEFVEHEVSGVDGAPELHCVRHNALRIGSAKRNIQTFGRPDIIYSVGLFDYIPDRLLIPMLQGLAQSLADGGVLYLAFKDADRYDKTVYHWMVDWFFFQRTAEECRELFRQADFDVDAMEMTRDETGIIINFINRVPANARFRVDPAQTTPEPQTEVQRPERVPGEH